MTFFKGKLGRLHKRMSIPAQSVSDLYMDILRRREESERSVVPSEQHDLLTEAVQKSHQVIERLALLGAALNSNFVAIEKKLNALGQTNPDLLKQIDEQIGSLVGLRNAFLEFYNDESIFCAQFERMVRTRMLVEAGVDPNDPEASMAFLIKAGKAQAVPNHDPSSN